MRSPIATTEVERWVAWVRIAAVPFAVFQVAVQPDHPGRTGLLAWLLTAAFAAGALLLFALSRRPSVRWAPILGASALAFDLLVVSGYVLIYHFEPGTPIRQLLYLPLVEAALRYGIVGAVALAVAVVPTAAGFELLISDRIEERPFEFSNVTFQLGVGVLMGLIVGWLVERLGRQTGIADMRAVEAERLRDALGRRVDLLEAANRCARALGSSLDLDQAFSAFIRELRGLVPFDRMAVVLAEGDSARVMAAAGKGSESVFPPGTSGPVEGSVLEEVLQGQLVYREDMQRTRHPEEEQFLGLGLRCRLAAPLLLGPRAIGMLSVVRAAPRSFTPEEMELLSLLGRLVATGVQNIRAYEAERRTVEELRRLSALRADFVSLVSHELRSPMAAVIGSARTLQQRWRELSPEQRESFLELIAGETNRLAALVSDVLDTSRIESGSFPYTFAEIDLAELVRDTVAAAGVGQDEVAVVAEVRDPLPRVRGDRARLRQVLTNLVDNAVKYSPAGSEVRVGAYARDGRVLVAVRDAGPGISPDHQRLIFEKFGRAKTDAAKPGTGLGLFIARSIAEAHGGTLEVDSVERRGSTFTLALPIP